MSTPPASTERAQAQRDRILDAARTCFAERGFHGASMASIAETAGMSAGLIYRYFDGKSEIIRGIVEQQLELLHEDLRQSSINGAMLSDHLFESYYKVTSDDRGRPTLHPGLIMEISAEAARDPIIGNALREFDDVVQKALEEWMQRPADENGPGIPKPEVATRALMLRFIIDGIKMRMAVQPDLDPQLLRRCLDELLLPILRTPD